MSTAAGEGETSADRNVEIWKIKKLIKSLEAARGYVLKYSVFVDYCIVFMRGSENINEHILTIFHF